MSKEIIALKKQVRLENWAAEVESCAASGLTVQQEELVVFNIDKGS